MPCCSCGSASPKCQSQSFYCALPEPSRPCASLFDSNTLPLVLALLTAVSSGLAYTMIAFCRGQVNPMTVIFHFSLFSTIAAGLLMIPSFVVPTPGDLMMLILIGIFGAGGQIGLTYAYQKAPAAEVSIYDYSGIIFSAILGYVLLDESLSLSTIVGAALITAGRALVLLCKSETGRSRLVTVRI
ncbi:MAG: DMT family transporter [Dysosmobacter sp.]